MKTPPIQNLTPQHPIYLEMLKLEQLLGSLEAHELKMKNREGIKKEEKDFEKALFVKNQKKGGGDSWKNKKGKGKWKYNKQESKQFKIQKHIVSKHKSLKSKYYKINKVLKIII